jgi:hypothetical protein
MATRKHSGKGEFSRNNAQKIKLDKKMDAAEITAITLRMYPSIQLIVVNQFNM